TAHGYRVELAVPWSSLGITPASGQGFGFDVAIDDKTLAGALTYADWMGLTSYNNPAGWGHVTLSATGPSSTTTTSSTGSTGSTTSTGSTGSTGASAATS